MSVRSNDKSEILSANAQARLSAARLLFDVLVERDLTAAERHESLTLLTALLASPLLRPISATGNRHPSISRAMTQLGALGAEIRNENCPTPLGNASVSWDCTGFGLLSSNALVPAPIGEMALSEIAGSCAEIQRAIDWHQPFQDARWNGLLLSGQPVFNLADGRFAGYRGTLEAELVKGPVPDVPTPDEEARLAHELRSPLGAILGFADLIAEQSLGPAPQEMQDGARRILATGASLLSALDDMTDAARLDLGRYPVELGWIDARLVIDRAVERFATLASDRQAVLRTAGRQPLWMQVDEQALQRLVERLLAGILGLAGPNELFELEAAPIAGDRVSLSLSRPTCLAGWSSDELRNPSAEFETSERAGQVVPMVGLGFALRLVGQLADRLGGCFTIEPQRFVVILPALQLVWVASKVRAT